MDVPLSNPFGSVPDCRVDRSRIACLTRDQVARFVMINQAAIRELARSKLTAITDGVLDSEEVFASVVRRLDRLATRGGVRPRSEAELWALVRTVTTNTAIEKNRLVVRARALVDNEGVYAQQLLLRLEACTTDDEAMLLVHRMALLLPEAADRQVLFLLLRGASFPAIAVALRCTEPAARKRWSRLKTSLEERFDHGYFDD